MSAPTCNYCKDLAPYGDARNVWIGAHNAWYHKLYWRLKFKLYICPKLGHHYVDAGDSLGGTWIQCTNCNKLEEYIPGVHEPDGYDPRK